MKNDYVKSHFWYRKDNKQYFIRVKHQWIEVSKEVYSICKNSHVKMYRDSYRDDKLIMKYNDNLIYISSIGDPIEYLHKKENKRVIEEAISQLSLNEQYIIYELYYHNKKEKEIAKKLNISQQLLNYKKKKILKKLKSFLLNHF